VRITGKQTKCSGKLYGIFAAKDLVLFDPWKNKMGSGSTMRRIFLVDAESISKVFSKGYFKPSYYHNSEKNTD